MPPALGQGNTSSHSGDFSAAPCLSSAWSWLSLPEGHTDTAQTHGRDHQGMPGAPERSPDPPAQPQLLPSHTPLVRGKLRCLDRNSLAPLSAPPHQGDSWHSCSAGPSGAGAGPCLLWDCFLSEKGQKCTGLPRERLAGDVGPCLLSWRGLWPGKLRAEWPFGKRGR